MSQIERGAVLFMYNTDSKALVGPFTAATSGATRLETGTWASGVDEHMVSENITVQWEDLHIIENADQHYEFLKNLKKCKLSSLQVQTLLDDLKNAPPYRGEKPIDTPT